jgi:succinate dehydrogenase hydrophobic anchor subunit
MTLGVLGGLGALVPFISALVGIFLAIGIVYAAYRIVSKLYTRYETGELEVKDVFWAVFKIILAGLVACALWILYWNGKQMITTNTSDYENPDKKKMINESLNHQESSKEEQTRKRKELIVEQYTKPHKETLSSFDKAMQQEEQKIKNRNNLD